MAKGKNKRDPIKAQKLYQKRHYEAVKVRNIPVELFQKWQGLKRWGDVGKMCKYFDILTAATISNALQYGHVSRLQPELADKISQWFLDRAEQEKTQPVGEASKALIEAE